jgi:hypothetical protein
MNAPCFEHLATACAVPVFVATGRMRVKQLQRRGGDFEGLGAVTSTTTVPAVLMTTVRGTSLDRLVLLATGGCAKSIETICAVTKNGMGAVDFDHCWSSTTYTRAPCIAFSDNDEQIPDYDCCPPATAMPQSALLIWRFIHTLVLDVGSQKPTVFGKNAVIKAHAQHLLGLGDGEDIFDAPPYYPYQRHAHRVATGAELAQYVKSLYGQAGGENTIDGARTRDAWAAVLMRLADLARVCDAPGCMMYMCDAKTANFMV